MEFSSTEPRLSSYLHARACRSGTPLAGNFELTARCNFNCKMCYVHLTAGSSSAGAGSLLPTNGWPSPRRPAAGACCSCC